MWRIFRSNFMQNHSNNQSNKNSFLIKNFEFLSVNSLSVPIKVRRKYSVNANKPFVDGIAIIIKGKRNWIKKNEGNKNVDNQ